MKLSILIVIRIDDKSLLIGYKSLKNRIIYDKIQDETVKLIISNRIMMNKVKKSKTDEDKINSNKIRKG